MRDEQKNFFDKSYHDLVQAPIDIADLMIAEYMKQIDRLQTFKRAVRAAAVAVTEVPTISLPARQPTSSSLPPSSGQGRSPDD